MMNRSGLFRIWAATAVMVVLSAALHATAAGVPASAPASMPASQPASFTFIHAGDPQIGGWVPIKESQARFIELARQADERGVDFVLVAGDLVHVGKDAEQLAAFRKAMTYFKVPVKLVPGNHDDLATFRKLFGKDYYSFTKDNYEFICLNSNLMLEADAGGKTEPQAQWQWLDRTLHTAQQARREIIVLMHHPPAALGEGADRFGKLMKKYAVKIVLAGHVHITGELAVSGYNLYTVGGTATVFDQKGYGYRLFTVTGPKVEQAYVRMPAVPTKNPAASQPASAVAQ